VVEHGGAEMSLWRAVLAFLTPKVRSSRRSWDPTTNPFDAERVAKQLRLEEQGRELGKAGVPLATDSSLSGPERSAALAVEQAKTDYVASYQHRLKALQAQASRLDPSARLAAALASAEQFERQADNLLTENAAQLQRFADVACSRRDALARFREKHRRVDLPDYPSKGKTRFLYAVAAALVLLETFFNASFFSTGLGGGLREGMVEAFVFSFINVSVAIFVGIHVVRRTNHVNVLWRLASYLVAMGALGLLTVLGLYVAHYRDALHLSVEGAGAVATQTLLSSPFGLAGPSSWALFGLSFFAACFAMWEGYTLNDPYPGYGAEHRKSEEAARKYDRAVQALRAELAKYRQTLTARMERTQEACQASIVELKSVISDKQRLGVEMRNEIGTLQAAIGALVETFRAANKVAREGKPAPDYFNATPLLEERALPDFATEDDEASLRRQQEAAAAFLHQKAMLSAKIESAFNDRYSSLQTLDDLFDPTRQMVSSASGSTAPPGTSRQEPGTPGSTSTSSSATVVPLRAADGGASS
jgi:hypothetical protein